jgi:23S rRNA C2498 (ribose-2'-O)-methylase RlmM
MDGCFSSYWRFDEGIFRLERRKHVWIVRIVKEKDAEVNHCCEELFGEGWCPSFLTNSPYCVCTAGVKCPSLILALS